jgi:death on curing protein
VIFFITLEELLAVAPDALGTQNVLVRDYGLLESALARPQTSLLGQDAYPDLHVKAAALLHSLANNRALVDGNKRLAWHATAVFLGINGQQMHAAQDDVVELVRAIAVGEIDNLDQIAAKLRCW